MSSKQINYKLLIELSVCGVFLLIGVLFALFAKPTSPKSKPREYNYNDLILVEKLEFELNSALNLYDFIDPENKMEIVTENRVIDTSAIGTQDVTIQYSHGALQYDKTFEIKITDKTGPTIAYNEELTTVVGKEIDLLDGVNAIDNSNVPIDVTVEGNYDFGRAGKYYLQYVAVDPSGNKTIEKFTLTINRNTTTTTKKTTTKKTTSSNQDDKTNSSNQSTEKPTEKTTEKTPNDSTDPNPSEEDTSNDSNNNEE